MLAKVIAYAPTRSEATRTLASALAGSQLHGITTNRDLLVRILRHPEFVAGDIDTDFLVRHDPAVLGAPIASDEAVHRHAVAAAFASQAARRSDAKVLGGIPSGWRNNFSEPQHTSFARNDGPIEVAYRFDRTGHRVDVSSPPDMVGVEVLSADPTRVVLCSGGVTRTYSVNQVVLHHFVDGPDGSSDLTQVERFKLPESQLEPGLLVATLPGTIVRVEVAVGDHVVAGDILVAIEAMKMEHEVRASHGGVVVSVAVAPGDQVDSGRLLVVVGGENEEEEEAPPDS
jgi:propionyl-CoA carboxylase alpha chain